jgi:hypothetical protein
MVYPLRFQFCENINKNFASFAKTSQLKITKFYYRSFLLKADMVNFKPDVGGVVCSQ